MGIKKGTKLTETPKDSTIKVRMDKETMEQLDAVCEKHNLTRSEVVRKGIKEQYEKIKA